MTPTRPININFHENENNNYIGLSAASSNATNNNIGYAVAVASAAAAQHNNNNAATTSVEVAKPTGAVPKAKTTTTGDPKPKPQQKQQQLQRHQPPARKSVEAKSAKPTFIFGDFPDYVIEAANASDELNGNPQFTGDRDNWLHNAPTDLQIDKAEPKTTAEQPQPHPNEEPKVINAEHLQQIPNNYNNRGWNRLEQFQLKQETVPTVLDYSAVVTRVPPPSPITLISSEATAAKLRPGLAGPVAKPNAHTHHTREVSYQSHLLLHEYTKCLQRLGPRSTLLHIERFNTKLNPLAAIFIELACYWSAFSSSVVESQKLPHFALINQLLNLAHFANSFNIIIRPAARPTSTSPSAEDQITRENTLVEMVRDTNPSASKDSDVIVNSTSLEDVALSEASDNRAQSIQSLHSASETPTPETILTYEDLQQRLEDSTRNIHSMQSQQEQLVRLQNAAKEHLNDMINTRAMIDRQNAANGNPDGSKQPNYEDIEEVHSDMSSLMGRIKKLNNFIQSQNELSHLLGIDNPELKADTEALQEKLESLQVQRVEMRNLVDELDAFNNQVENTRRQGATEAEEDEEQEEQEVATVETLPVGLSRVVQIECLRKTGQLPPETSSDKVSSPNSTAPDDSSGVSPARKGDLDSMTAQLQRLKSMLETVNLIEAQNSRDPKEIGRSIPPAQARGRQSNDRERTPVPEPIRHNTSPNNDTRQFIDNKERLLNSVTADLRAQTESLQAERDRIKALKAEIIRRKEQAAAAAQMGEDALKRHSLTPTPNTATRRQAEIECERDRLRAEYDMKKKEFELLCHRLNNEDGTSTTATGTEPNNKTTTTDDGGSEADEDTTEEDLNDVELKLCNKSKHLRKMVQAQRQEQLSDTTTAAASTTVEQFRPVDTTRHGPCCKIQSKGQSNNAAAGVDSMLMDGASVHLGTRPYGNAVPTAWNPQIVYGVSVMPPPLPAAVTGMPSAGVYGSSAFTPIPTSAAPGAPTPGAECICPGPNMPFAAMAATAAGVGVGGGSFTPDPMLYQQMVQTQQMLINSMCQANTMLWHQQAEIDSLNNVVLLLQDRINTLSQYLIENPYAGRAEIVPPTPTNFANNVAANRAQSEQPNLFSAPLPSTNSRIALMNYQQQQQLQQNMFQLSQQRATANLASGGSGFTNYTTETQQQQQNTTNTSRTMYTTLNNMQQQRPASPAAKLAPQPATPLFNNEAPQSPMGGSGPAPIFMHHHNNAIHQNNANLRTQNHHANLPQHHHQQQHSNLDGVNTLNNQVPPGIRANNYWDNFRSYSRQNLLSTNSNKSNEEQQHHQQQPSQDGEDELYDSERPDFSNNGYRRYHVRQPHHQGEHQLRQHESQHALYQQATSSDVNYASSNSNNATNYENEKYATNVARMNLQPKQQPQNGQTVESLQRNHFEAARDRPHNYRWHEDDNDVYEAYDDDMGSGMLYTPIATAANIRNNNHIMNNMNNNIHYNNALMNNMAVNFGNSPRYQRNKVPATKPTCHGSSDGSDRKRSHQQQQSQQPRQLPQQPIPRQQQQHSQEQFQQLQQHQPDQSQPNVQSQPDQKSPQPQDQEQENTHQHESDSEEAAQQQAQPQIEPQPQSAEQSLQQHQQKQQLQQRQSDHEPEEEQPNEQHQSETEEQSQQHDLLLLDTLQNVDDANTSDAEFEEEIFALVPAVSSPDSGARMPAGIDRKELPQFLFQALRAIADDYESINAEGAALPTTSAAGQLVVQEKRDISSDEMKRNLLVTALKNEKFNSNFYECIKEDVCRRLENLFTDNKDEPKADQSKPNPAPPLDEPQRHDSPAKELILKNVRSDEEKFNFIAHLKRRNRERAAHEIAVVLPPARREALPQTSHQAEAAIILDPSRVVTTVHEFPTRRKESDNWCGQGAKKRTGTSGANAPKHPNADSAPPVGFRSRCTRQLAAEANQSAAGKKKKRKNHNKQNQQLQPTRNDTAAEGAAPPTAELAAPEKSNETEDSNSAAVTDSYNTTTKANNTTAHIESKTIGVNFSIVPFIIDHLTECLNGFRFVNSKVLLETAKITASATRYAIGAGLVSDEVDLTYISPRRVFNKLRCQALPTRVDQYLVWCQMFLHRLIFGRYACTEELLIYMQEVGDALSTEGEGEAGSPEAAESPTNDAEIDDGHYFNLVINAELTASALVSTPTVKVSAKKTNLSTNQASSAISLSDLAIATAQAELTAAVKAQKHDHCYAAAYVSPLIKLRQEAAMAAERHNRRAAKKNSKQHRLLRRLEKVDTTKRKP